MRKCWGFIGLFEEKSKEKKTQNLHFLVFWHALNLQDSPLQDPSDGDGIAAMKTPSEEFSQKFKKKLMDEQAKLCSFCFLMHFVISLLFCLIAPGAA